jgi:hypothetical protein
MKKKPKQKTRSFAARLQEIEVGISGVKNTPEIQAELDKFGYTPERIAEGEALLAEVRGKKAFQAEKYSDRYVASDEFGREHGECYGTYMITLKVARVALRTQPGRLQEIRATGIRRRSLSGWLDDANVMYPNLLTPAILPEMEKFGYTAERLQQEHEQVKTVAALHSKQLQESGMAQQSTVERDRSIDELCSWYSDFRAIARVALYEHRQWLEVLGIVAK